MTWRRSTAGARALPTFVIIGAQKAGTTSLYRYLCDHPDVVPAARKEVHYFDVNYASGEGWYRSNFPLRLTLQALGRRRGRRVITGEATPYYLFHPLAAERLRALLPDAKLVVLLRDPVERAFSHYRHEVAAGREPLSFADAVRAEAARTAGEQEQLHSGAVMLSEAHRNQSYVARGRYAEQLERWLACFDRDQILVLRSEDLLHAPAATYERVTDFIGLPRHRGVRFDVHNRGAEATPDEATQRELEATFDEPNRRLRELLGWTSWP